jgi:hypothetical protein
MLAGNVEMGSDANPQRTGTRKTCFARLLAAVFRARINVISDNVLMSVSSTVPLHSTSRWKHTRERAETRG